MKSLNGFSFYFNVLFNIGLSVVLLLAALLLLLKLLLVLMLLLLMMMVLLQFFVHADQIGYRVSFLLLSGRSRLGLLLRLLLGLGNLLLVRLEAGTKQIRGVLLHLSRRRCCRHVDVPTVADHVLHHLLLLLLRLLLIWTSSCDVDGGNRQPVRRPQMVAQPFGRLEGLAAAKVVAAVPRRPSRAASCTGHRSTLLEIDRRMAHLHVLRQVVLHGEAFVTAENGAGEKSSVQVPLDVLL